jgi:hypothetical protein
MRIIETVLASHCESPKNTVASGGKVKVRE